MPRFFVNAENADRKTARLVRKAVRTALRHEGISFRASVSVTVTDDAGIRELNRVHRNIDAPTDVLSFPLLDWTNGRGEAPGDVDADPRTGAVELGDIVISRERVAAQAEEYGHTVEREFAYLVVHSALHLLGYDHTDEGERKVIMRAREEEILAGMGIRRE